jgi:hypothetical protein
VSKIEKLPRERPTIVDDWRCFRNADTGRVMTFSDGRMVHVDFHDGEGIRCVGPVLPIGRRK